MLRPDGLSLLKSQETLLLFAYASTGLGHLRVTDALWRGLQTEGAPLVLGANDKTLAAAHRLLSQRKAFQALFEWGQSGRPQSIFTPFYRSTLRRNTADVRNQIQSYVAKRIERPKRLVVVATHFDIAHRIAAAKDAIQKQLGVPLSLTVQITDDSPQHIWMVPGADLLCGPSHFIRDELIAYAAHRKLKSPPFVVLPYPIPLELGERLSPAERASRTEQLRPESAAKVEVAVPISGAAAGLPFLGGVMDGLRDRSPRFSFQIVSRTAPYTRPFLDHHGDAGAHLHTAPHNREVIAAYRELYEQHPIALELTKPSEQAFKAMTGPASRGGAILILAPPVGRQEIDNVAFLTRHQLIPDAEAQRALLALAAGKRPFAQATQALQELARGWRSLELPRHPDEAAAYVHWALQGGLFAQMDTCEEPWRRGTPHAAIELRPDGVRQFWEQVAQLHQG